MEYFVSGAGPCEEVRAGVAGLDAAVKLPHLQRKLIQFGIDGPDVVVLSQLLNGLMVLFGLKLVSKLGGWRQSGQKSIEVAFLYGVGDTKYFLGSSKWKEMADSPMICLVSSTAM